MLSLPEQNTSPKFPKNVTALPLNAPTEAALEETLRPLESADLSGVAFFLPSGTAELSLTSPSGSALQVAFLLAKLLGSRLRSNQSGRSFFLAITQLDGRFGTRLGARGWLDRGISGLTKTLALEWPEVFCRTVDLAHNMAPEGSVSSLFEELQDPDTRLLETGWDVSGRWGLLPGASAPWGEPVAPPSEPVWLVSGGARGVTADCVLELARRHSGTFLLLGRSPLEDEPAWALGLASEAELRQAAMQAILDSGEKPTPAKLRQEVSRILAGRSIRKTLSLLSDSGSTGVYLSVDATDASALQKTLKPLVSQYGPVTGVIHGAGVLADKLIEKKTEGDFASVVGTKVSGLHALLSAVEADRLTHLLLFSSGAGFYGNTGQSDYAMGNEVLNRVALAFQQQHPDCQVLSYNWGPWEGGMVTPELKRMFEERGVEVIPVATGARIFADAALHRHNGMPLLLVGNALSVQTEPPGPLQRQIRRTLAPEKNPVLQDHRIGSNAVVPAVCALSWMVDAASAALPGFHLESCNDFKVLKGVIFDETLAPEYLLDLQEVARDSGTSIDLKVQVSSQTGKKLPRFHYSVTCRFTTTPPVAPQGSLPLLGEAQSALPLYQNGTLFHGPLFQSIQEVLLLNESQLIVRCASPDVPPLEQGQFPDRLLNPYALDPAFQAMLVWARHHYDSGSLPLKFDRMEHYSHIAFQTEFLISMSVLSASETALQADLELLSPDGALHSRISGAEVTLSKNLNELFQPAAIPR